MKKARPPTLIVPVRAAPVFAAAVYEIVPLPLPDAVPLIVIHESLLAAFQGQPLSEAVRVKKKIPPER